MIEADSEQQARQAIRKRGLFPMTLDATTSTDTTSLWATLATYFRRPYHVTHQALALITRQLAALLSAGLTIEEALSAIIEQNKTTKVKTLLLHVRAKVLEGFTFARALTECGAFPSIYCATIAAGEKAGHLDQILLRLAEHTERQWYMRQKFSTALIYPISVITIAIAIVSFLLAYVVPKMISVYSNLRQTLPALTTYLIHMSQFIHAHGLLLLLGIVLGCYGFYYAYRNSTSLRTKTHQLLLTLPLSRYIVSTADTARFTRTLAMLTASGMPILEAMRIATQLMSMLPIRDALQLATQHVQDGASLHTALKQTSYFTPMSIHMIASGETSGHLTDMLCYIAKHQEDDLTRLIDISLTLFEPIMILVMGAIVLFIVLAVLLPIFELNQFTG